MKTPPEEILLFLDRIGATKTSHHAGRSLNDHLIGTWSLLFGWNVPGHVAVAGLCHSVYGTDAFETACLGPQDREQVQVEIGRPAESVAFYFGALDREKFLADLGSCQIVSRFDGSGIRISPDDRNAICDILLANELDLVFAKKGRDRPDKVLKKVGPVFDLVSPYLSPAAVEFYRNATSPVS